MTWSEISWRPSDRQLRGFAFGCLLFSLLFAARWNFLAGLLIGVGIVIATIGLLRPQWIRPLYMTWTIAVFPIGWTISKLVLALLFYGVFTPLGLLFRLLGRDTLNLKLQPGAESYWITKETPKDPRRYLQQY